MNTISPVRPSPIAGSWYPKNPEILTSEIEDYLEKAVPQKINGEVVGLISPHAGYYYSGSTAGYSYRCVKGKQYDLCVIFSPLHDYLPYDLLTTAHDAYGTPLGEVRVDQELIEKISLKIKEKTGLSLQHIANDREHSLEIQIPFLQRALTAPFILLPIMVRTHDPKVLKLAAEAIAGEINKINTLLVASTDLSHFYSESEANAFDDEMIRRMVSFSPEGVLEAERYGEGFACGAGAVALMLWTARSLVPQK